MKGKALGSNWFLTESEVEFFVVEQGVVWIIGGMFVGG